MFHHRFGSQCLGHRIFESARCFYLRGAFGQLEDQVPFLDRLIPLTLTFILSMSMDVFSFLAMSAYVAEPEGRMIIASFRV